MGKYVVHQLDSNHRTIRDGLKARGCSVYSGGPLDLIVGRQGRTYLLEVKTAKGKVRPSQEAFLALWRGHAVIVRTLDEALIAVGLELPAGLRPRQETAF
jgi:hypothetical protein